MNAQLSLNLLVIRAKEPDVVCRFYQALGLSFSREQHGKGPLHHACELGSSVFEIYPRRGDEAATTGTRLGFAVPSLDEALDALRAENAMIVSAPTPTTRRAVVTDPEGHRVELVER
jgi:predicted enzyme related to lactoylglutathione lyase